LQILGFIEAIFWREGAEERVWAFVERHGAGWVAGCEGGDGVVGGLEVG
jgi:hypothetical protein